MFTFRDFECSQQADLKLTKSWVKIIAKFQNFLDNKSKLYIVKPSTREEDYSPSEQNHLKKIIKNAYDSAQISSVRLESLLFVVETNLQGKVTGVMVVDRNIVNDYANLVSLLATEDIVEIVL